MGKGDRGRGSEGVSGAPMIATATGTNKTAERVMGIERGRVSKKTEACCSCQVGRSALKVGRSQTISSLN